MRFEDVNIILFAIKYLNFIARKIKQKTGVKYHI